MFTSWDHLGMNIIKMMMFKYLQELSRNQGLVIRQVWDIAWETDQIMKFMIKSKSS